MRNGLRSAVIAFAVCGVVLSGCKVAQSDGVKTAPTLTFTEATNASLQAAHKFGMDVAGSVQSGALSLNPEAKRAFDAFASSLNATDALFIEYVRGTATQKQVENSLNQTVDLEATAQGMLPGATR